MRSAWALAALAIAAVLALGATQLLPARVAEVARSVEEVRGRRFEKPVPASEIETPELKRILRSKIAESLPASPEDTVRTLVAFGLIEDTPNLVDRLVEFYASQVIAFYDPQTRRFYIVHGAEKTLQAASAEGGEGMSGIAERLIFAHELTHALQDEFLRLDSRMKELKDNGDRALALECLLEGEATLVMVRVALKDLPGADEKTEEALAPLLSAGTLERANTGKDIPEYFVDQLFFPYTEGTAYVRRLAQNGWSGVDRAWKNAPLSTSEILHEGLSFTPAADLLPKNPETLAPPAFRFLYADTAGEWGIRFLLRRGLETGEADAVAALWRGDRLAFFSSAGRIAYLWRVRLESPAGAERFETAWKKVRQKSGISESLSRSGREILVTSNFPKVPELLR
ncbi:MAG: hypothetical protein ACRD1P_01685 [Thermoanaerobaculia bacterium]